MERPDDGDENLKIYISELILNSYKYSRNNESNYFTLITITVARFVGIGVFIIRCFNGHTK
jgi:hypothetical protein